jgi:hypothetical protein
MAIKALSPAEDLLKDTLMQLAEFMKNYDKYGVAYASAMDLTTGESYIAKSIRTALEDTAFGAYLKQFNSVSGIGNIEVASFIERVLGEKNYIRYNIDKLKTEQVATETELIFGGSCNILPNREPVDLRSLSVRSAV